MEMVQRFMLTHMTCSRAEAQVNTYMNSYGKKPLFFLTLICSIYINPSRREIFSTDAGQLSDR